MSVGAFITLEGTEGVGKSTNLQRVVNALEAAGIEEVVVTREPGGTPLAEEIRAIILQAREEQVHALAELLLMFAARAQNLHTLIEPALQRGAWVVCDRFTDATYAYQGGGRGLDTRVIATLEQLVQQGRQPDLTIYLDLDHARAAERIKDREHDRIEREQTAFFDRVRASYLARAQEATRFRVIDASDSLEVVGVKVTRTVEEFVEQWR